MAYFPTFRISDTITEVCNLITFIAEVREAKITMVTLLEMAQLAHPLARYIKNAGLCLSKASHNTPYGGFVIGCNIKVTSQPGGFISLGG